MLPGIWSFSFLIYSYFEVRAFFGLWIMLWILFLRIFICSSYSSVLLLPEILGGADLGSCHFFWLPDNLLKNNTWGIYPEKTIIRKNTCTPMFTATLFTIAKTWKQPKCPLKEEWIKKMWYIYTMEYYSAIKKNKMHEHAICSNMDEPKDYHTK